MRLEISLEYYTSPEEELYLVIADGKSVAMRNLGGGLWTASLEIHDNQKDLEYSFEVHRHGHCARREWRAHRVTIPPEGGDLVIRDRWQDRPEDSPFWTKAFADVIFKRPEVDVVKRSGNVTFTVPCARVREGEVLAITGSGALFDNWKTVIPLIPVGTGLWSISLNASESFEYKFVISDSKTLGIKIWESGSNHRLTEIPKPGSTIEIKDIVPVLETIRWRGAGTAIPVFSLRSESGFGIGEFNDLKKLADWAALTGQRLIQILPVNDTTMTGTWKDSYPYNANSTFALHPQFIHLPDAGVEPNKEYLDLQKELNAIPSVDYERVNKEKTRLLREAFKTVGQEVISDKEYKKFLSANRGWLIPYAVFSVLRDQNGTPEFGKWKTLSEYSEAKVMSFRRRHKAETDFYCYVQFCLDAQLKEAVEYAHSKGIVIKGDLPIGISRTSVDAWMYPTLFNLDSQAGAPPDAFSTDGQNWGFPTYNWEEMAKDGYAWWKARLRKMSEYFDAFRIDHILGFFRIWEIPVGVKSGLSGHFNPALPYSFNELKEKGFDPASRLFLPDPHRAGWYHPYIAARDTEDFLALDDRLKESYNDLYDDFFYRRHNDFWKASAMRKLPALLDSTGMLACGEDLGMIPACVPDVMRDLRILSLEIQRMPKSPGKEFDDPSGYPYLSVCATGTHDTSTLRGWWEENRQMSERFFHEMLHCEGSAPVSCEPWVCEMVVRQHLASPSMLCVLPLQDWLSIDGNVRYNGVPADERINIPADSNHYWRWRMHLTLEDLLSRSAFNTHMHTIISSAGRTA